MVDVSKYFSYQTVTGEPQVIGDRVIRLQAWAIMLNTPFGGFLWNRPTAVLVEKEGEIEEIPIVDATRFALISIDEMGVVGTVLAKLRAGAKR